MLLNASELISEIKKIAVNAVDSEKPCDVIFGSVISESPLKINVEQKLTLTEEQLVLSRNVTDYEIEINIEDKNKWLTETAELHKHEIKGKKKVKVLGSLKTGEKVILARIKGGQKFAVLDRIGEL